MAPACTKRRSHTMLHTRCPCPSSVLLPPRCRLRITLTRTTAESTAATRPIATSTFAVEDYLAASCHLTPTPHTPQVRLQRGRSFLMGFGLSPKKVVDRSLAPISLELRALGLSPSQVARLVQIVDCYFLYRRFVSKTPSMEQWEVEDDMGPTRVPGAGWWWPTVGQPRCISTAGYGRPHPFSHPPVNQKARRSLSLSLEAAGPTGQSSSRLLLLPSSRRRIRSGFGTEQPPPMLLRHGGSPCAPERRAPSGRLCGGSPAARCCAPLRRACFLRPANKNSGGALR
ncbi:hypothetical protein HU200_028905 [Digitaria exilis]|uniref:Uncharacterized protein n=1 Tax=Digitaria exilis TaxID=1010633 RepID=A0A835ESD1_9POAL|nr:hypothetical protein HU200_028905 [Digitaria exilis]